MDLISEKMKNNMITETLKNEIPNFDNFDIYYSYCKIFLINMENDGIINTEVRKKELQSINDNKEAIIKELQYYNHPMYDIMLGILLIRITSEKSYEFDYLYDKHQRLFPTDDHIIIEDDYKYKVLYDTFDIIFDELFGSIKVKFNIIKLINFFKKHKIKISSFGDDNLKGIRIPKNFDFLQNDYPYIITTLTKDFILDKSNFFKAFRDEYILMLNWNGKDNVVNNLDKYIKLIFNNMSCIFNARHFKNLFKDFTDNTGINIVKLNDYINTID